MVLVGNLEELGKALEVEVEPEDADEDAPEDDEAIGMSAPLMGLTPSAGVVANMKIHAKIAWSSVSRPIL